MAVREVTEFTSLGGAVIFVRGGENFDEPPPPAGGVKSKVPPLPDAKNFRRPPFHKFST